MIDHVWTVLCSRIIIDRDKNNVSLIDVIERLTLHVPPNLPESVLPAAHIELASLWARSDGQTPTYGKCRVRFEDPTGKEHELAVEQEIDLLSHMRLRTIARLDIGFNQEGTYKIRVDLKKEKRWKKVAQIPLEIRIKETASESAGREKHDSEE